MNSPQVSAAAHWVLQCGFLRSFLWVSPSCDVIAKLLPQDATFISPLCTLLALGISSPRYWGGGVSGGPQRKHPAISFLRWWQELTLPQDAKPQSGILTPRLYSNSGFLGYLIHHPLPI